MMLKDWVLLAALCFVPFVIGCTIYYLYKGEIEYQEWKQDGRKT